MRTVSFMKTGFLIIAMLLTACASNPQQTPEQQVAQRAEARWKRLIAKDYQQAWEYLMPSYRNLVSPQDYGKRFGSAGAWTNAIIHEVTCEPSVCKVKVRVTTKMRVPLFAAKIPEVNTYVDERWVREDGQWWLYEKL